MAMVDVEQMSCCGLVLAVETSSKLKARPHAPNRVCFASLVSAPGLGKGQNARLASRLVHPSYASQQR